MSTVNPSSIGHKSKTNLTIPRVNHKLQYYWLLGFRVPLSRNGLYDPSPLRHSRDCRRQTGSDFFLPIFHAFVPVSWSRIRVCQQAHAPVNVHGAGTCQQDVPASPTVAPLPGILLAVEQHGFCFMRRTWYSCKRRRPESEKKKVGRTEILADFPKHVLIARLTAPPLCNLSASCKL